MSELYMGIILVCACAGIISELITIAVPEKIISIVEKEPEELLKKRFYRMLFTLSGLYLLVVLLLFLSGNDRFQIYGLVILILSTIGWLFRKKLRQHMYLLVAESTVSLIVLIDVVRRIVQEMVL